MKRLAKLVDFSTHLNHSKTNIDHFHLENKFKNVFTITFKTPLNVNPVLSTLASRHIRRSLAFHNAQHRFFGVHQFPSHTTFSYSSDGDMKLCVESLLQHIFQCRMTENQVFGDLQRELYLSEQNLSFCIKREMLERLYSETGVPYNPLTLDLLSKTEMSDVEKFMRDFYHPSRGCVVTSGSETFEREVEKAVGSFGKITFSDPIPSGLFTKSEITVPGPKGGPPLFGISFLMNDTSDSYETSLFSTLTRYLVSYRSTPLHFENAHMMSESGYEMNMKRSCLSLVYNGEVPTQKVIEEKIRDFRNIRANPSDILPILTGSEIHLRELPFQEAAFPLFVASLWVHGRDIVTTLDLKSVFQKLTNEFNSGRYLERLGYLEKYQLVTMTPDYEVVEPTEIKVTQIQPKEVSLPFVPPSLPNIALKRKGSISYNHLSNNGLIQVTLKSAMSSASTKDSPDHLPFVCSILENIGARELRSYQFGAKIASYCADFRIKPFIEQDPENIDSVQIGALFLFTCLSKDVNKMVDILDAIFHESLLFSNDSNVISDMSELLDLIRYQRDEQIQVFLPEMMRIHSGMCLTPFFQIGSIFTGEVYQAMVTRLIKMDRERVIKSFRECARSILNGDNLTMLITSENEIPAFESWVDSIPKSNKTALKRTFSPRSYQEAIVMDNTPAIILHSIRCLPFQHEDTPILMIMSRILVEKMGPKHIRVDYTVHSGVLSFMAVKPESVVDSLDIMTKFPDIFIASQFSAEDVEIARESCIQSLLSIDEPHDLGRFEFLYRWTQESIDVFINTLKTVTHQDCVSAAKLYFIGNANFKDEPSPEGFYKNITILAPDALIPDYCKYSDLWRYQKPEEPKQETKE